MSLLGPAAILISFDIEPAAVAEHDEWHSREHMPERLSIPGFRRGTRWRNESRGPGYLVIYEVADAAVLTSDAYLQRLDHPTPWTTAMMKSYRNMARGLCEVVASVGQGLGGAALFIGLAAGEGQEDELRRRLRADVLPWLSRQSGIIAAHLLEAIATAPMTREQRIRGKDAGIRFALFATGHDHAALTRLLDPSLRALAGMIPPSATPRAGVYRLAATFLDVEARTA
jgi:hypothetical protein